MKYPNRIKELRKRANLSQRKLADEIGGSEAALQNYEYGERDLPGDIIIRLCEMFNCTADYLICVDSEKNPSGLVDVIKPSYSYHVVPIVGDVAAGDPCEAIELIDDVLTVPEAFRETHPDARALRIRGESMNKLFQADSFVIFDPELEVRDGDIAVVYVNGDDATVKRVYFAGDTVVLHPESTMEEHLDRAINTKDPSSPPVTFAGRVFWATWGDNDVRF